MNQQINESTQGSKNIWVIIIAIALLVGGILTWQYLGVSKEEVKVPEEIVKKETADWQTYHDEKYGFEVKYPNYYRIEIDTPPVPAISIYKYCIIFLPKDFHGGITELIVGVTEISATTLINELKNQVPEEFVKVIEEKEIDLNGVPVKKLILPEPFGYNTLHYIFEKNGVTFWLKGISGEKDQEQVLSTFKFLE